MEARPVAAGKARDRDAHFLALQTGCQAKAEDDDVSPPCDGDRFGLQGLRGCRPQELELSLPVGFFAVHTQAVAAARRQLQWFALRKARVGELPVVGWIDRLHHQAVVEIELELDGANKGESVRAGVPWPQGAGPANAEVIGVHVGARSIFAPMRIEGG